MLQQHTINLVTLLVVDVPMSHGPRLVLLVSPPPHFFETQYPARC